MWVAVNMNGGGIYAKVSTVVEAVGDGQGTLWFGLHAVLLFLLRGMKRLGVVLLRM